MNAEELQNILAEHQLWLKSGGRAGKRANLHKAHQRFFSFRGIDLTEANLAEADLQAIYTQFTNLQRANLQNIFRI